MIECKDTPYTGRLHSFKIEKNVLFLYLINLQYECESSSPFREISV